MTETCAMTMEKLLKIIKMSFFGAVNEPPLESPIEPIDPCTPGHFGSLPTEILQEIAGYLEPEHQAMLILTCKYVKAIVGEKSWHVLRERRCHPHAYPHPYMGRRCNVCASWCTALGLVGRDMDPRYATVCFAHGKIHTRRTPGWNLVSQNDQNPLCDENTQLPFLSSRRIPLSDIQMAAKGHMEISHFQQIPLRRLNGIAHIGPEEQPTGDVTFYAKNVNNQLILAMQLRYHIPVDGGAAPYVIQNLRAGGYMPVDCPFRKLAIVIRPRFDGKPPTSNGKLRLLSYEHYCDRFCHYPVGFVPEPKCVPDYRTVEVQPVEGGICVKVDIFMNLEEGYQEMRLWKDKFWGELKAEHRLPNEPNESPCKRRGRPCQSVIQNERLERIVERDFRDHERRLERVRNLHSKSSSPGVPHLRISDAHLDGCSAYNVMFGSLQRRRSP